MANRHPAVGTKVLNLSMLLVSLGDQLRGFNIMENQTIVPWGDRDMREMISCHVGIRTSDAHDYHVAISGGFPELFLRRQKSATVKTCVAKLQSREYFLAQHTKDPAFASECEAVRLSKCSSVLNTLIAIPDDDALPKDLNAILSPPNQFCRTLRLQTDAWFAKKTVTDIAALAHDVHVFWTKYALVADEIR